MKVSINLDSDNLQLLVKLGVRFQLSGLESVRDFHRKFNIPVSDKPRLLNEHLLEFRTKFLQEELDEFIEAHEQGNLADCGDALIDLVYVAYGTADIMGLPWELMWAEVQQANMSKVRATSSDQSKRGTSFDVVKPAGWEPPDHTKYVGNFWETFEPGE